MELRIKKKKPKQASGLPPLNTQPYVYRRFGIRCSTVVQLEIDKDRPHCPSFNWSRVCHIRLMLSTAIEAEVIQPSTTLVCLRDGPCEEEYSCSKPRTWGDSIGGGGGGGGGRGGKAGRVQKEPPSPTGSFLPQTPPSLPLSPPTCYQ